MSRLLTDCGQSLPCFLGAPIFQKPVLPWQLFVSISLRSGSLMKAERLRGRPGVFQCTDKRRRLPRSTLRRAFL